MRRILAVGSEGLLLLRSLAEVALETAIGASTELRSRAPELFGLCEERIPGLTVNERTRTLKQSLKDSALGRPVRTNGFPHPACHRRRA